jgi:hypothetical protein
LHFKLETANLKVVDGKVVCGEMNAKNGFGGYIGFQPFYSRPVRVGDNVLGNFGIIECAPLDADSCKESKARYDIFCSVSPEERHTPKPTPQVPPSKPFTPAYPSPDNPRARVLLRACIEGKVYAINNEKWELFYLGGSTMECVVE